MKKMSKKNGKGMGKMPMMPMGKKMHKGKGMMVPDAKMHPQAMPKKMC